MSERPTPTQLLGGHFQSFAMLLHLVARLENMNDGPFKSGWESAIEEAGAFLDSTAKDGGDQAQTLMEQMIGLLNGVYTLVEIKGPIGVVKNDLGSPRPQSTSQNEVETAE